MKKKPFLTFREIISRITGVSLPFFGVSWEPSDTQRKIIRDFLIFLEDRRVMTHSCTGGIFVSPSIIEIREVLTETLQRLDDKSPAVESLNNMRTACREFLDAQEKGSSFEYRIALLGLQRIFARHVAYLAAEYGIDLGPNLANLVLKGSSLSETPEDIRLIDEKAAQMLSKFKSSQVIRGSEQQGDTNEKTEGKEEKNVEP
jgi:hypothetical protein